MLWQWSFPRTNSTSRCVGLEQFWWGQCGSRSPACTHEVWNRGCCKAQHPPTAALKGLGVCEGFPEEGGIQADILCSAPGQPLAELEFGNKRAKQSGRCWASAEDSAVPLHSPWPPSSGSVPGTGLGPLCKCFCKESRGFMLKYF